LDIKLEFIFEEDKVLMISKHYSIYSLTHKITNRGRHTLLIPGTLP